MSWCEKNGSSLDHVRSMLVNILELTTTRKVFIWKDIDKRNCLSKCKKPLIWLGR